MTPAHWFVSSSESSWHSSPVIQSQDFQILTFKYLWLLDPGLGIPFSHPNSMIPPTCCSHSLLLPCLVPSWITGFLFRSKFLTFSWHKLYLSFRARILSYPKPQSMHAFYPLVDSHAWACFGPYFSLVAGVLSMLLLVWLLGIDCLLYFLPLWKLHFLPYHLMWSWECGNDFCLVECRWEVYMLLPTWCIENSTEPAEYNLQKTLFILKW